MIFTRWQYNLVKGDDSMARFIDADAFEKFIKEKYKDGESTDDIKDQVLFDLSYQPTAYDVEKVVEEIEEEKFKNPFDEDEKIINSYINRAIKAVRKGGVE